MFELLLSKPMALLTGFLVTVALGMLVRPIWSFANARPVITPPKGIDPAEWLGAVDLDTGRSSNVLGFMERLLCFAAFSAAQPEIVAGWLVFKLGAKWESWANIVKVPEKLTGSTCDLSYLRARHEWGTKTLSTFLVGTLANVLVGFAGAKIGQVLMHG